MEKLSLNTAYKKWCKETKRSGGVLVGGSIREFFAWYESQPTDRTYTLHEVIGLAAYISQCEVNEENWDLKKYLDALDNTKIRQND